MNDSRLVREFERIEQLAHDAHRLAGLELLARLEEIAQLAPFDELHHDVGDITLLAEVVDLDDIRVIEPAYRPRLARKPRRVGPFGLHIDDHALEDGLHRHTAIERRVETLVDHSHRALAEHAAQLVAPEPGEFRHVPV